MIAASIIVHPLLSIKIQSLDVRLSAWDWKKASYQDKQAVDALCMVLIKKPGLR
jgi:hypothetical protein